MIKELDQAVYEYLLKCLKEVNKSRYCESIANSLVIDYAIRDLGFKKQNTYTVDINISDQDINEILDYLDTLHKKDYEKFDYYVEFYNIIRSLKP